MTSVKLYPRIDKLNSKDEAPIYLRLTKNRKSKYIVLDAYVNPEDAGNKTRITGMSAVSRDDVTPPVIGVHQDH